MHPEPREVVFAAGPAALGDLALVVGKMLSSPPVWMSITSRSSTALAIALHSMCQPGYPGPQGLSHFIRCDASGFHNKKSAGCFLFAVFVDTTRPPAPPLS